MSRIWPQNDENPPADQSQKDAAEAFRQYGKILIEAAPGTGKTFLGVYLANCAYQLDWTTSDSPSLFLTFSRNARVQIEQEIQRFIQMGWFTESAEKSIKVYNYHSLYFEMIQRKSGLWGGPQKLRPASIMEHRTWLQSLLTPEEQSDQNALMQASMIFGLERFDIGDLHKFNVQLCLKKETKTHILSEATKNFRDGRLQYDDFAPLFLNILELCPEFVEWLRLKYPVIILDEFQDTDIIQWEIIRKINPTRLVFLYDRYQMIYEWRGARTERLLQVKKQFDIQKNQEKQLTQIHRCGGQAHLAQFIQQLRADELLGNTVAKHKDRPWLQLFISRPVEKGRIIPDENRCLSWLRFNNRLINFNETTAILSRTNYLANYLFEHLRVRPGQGSYYSCRWIGSDDNPDEKIRDWLWQLRTIQADNELRGWLGNILDELLPKKKNRELGVIFSTEFQKDMEQLLARKKKEIFQTVRADWLPVWSIITVDNIISLSIGLDKVLATAGNLIAGEGYLNPDLIYYLKQLKRAVEKYHPAENGNQWLEFCAYLENSHLRNTFLKLRRPTTGLHILTIHQSKGREFDHVIIPWLSGSGEPHKTKDGRRFPMRLDYNKLEDRKLLYVALTRARKRVTILYPQDDPSPFLLNWKLIA